MHKNYWFLKSIQIKKKYFCQTPVQSLESRLGVDFVFPLSQEQEQEQEQEQSPPKYSRRKHSRSLKFDTQNNTLAPTPLPNGH